MIPILSAEQIRKADAFTIEHEPISSHDLMERAGKACALWLKTHFSSESTSFVIVCGQGNNGGDGLVIARHLITSGYSCQVWIYRQHNKGSVDFEYHFKLLKPLLKKSLFYIDKKNNFIAPESDKVIIDALYGTGFNKEPSDGLMSMFSQINSSGCRVISVDVPSGIVVNGNNSTFTISSAVRANHTLTFQLPKLAFMLPDCGEYAGQFHILPIGLDEDFINKQETNDYFIEACDIQQGFLKRSKFSHKGTYGHALIIAGSHCKTGAAVLSARACLRSGAGLLTVHVPSDSLGILQTAVPEAMASVDSDPKIFTYCKLDEKYSAIAIGPGLGTDKKTASALKMIIQNAAMPLILDADALNILAENKTWLSFLPANSILTPHPKEFERLFGKTTNHAERLNLQKSKSIKLGIYIVLKGAHTCITSPSGKAYFNSTGNPGMGTGGSGDVLTGIIAGLYVQTGYSAFASINGVFLHGLAGDIASHSMGQNALTAGDIVDCLGQAFLEFE